MTDETLTKKAQLLKEPQKQESYVNWKDRMLGKAYKELAETERQEKENLSIQIEQFEKHEKWKASVLKKAYQELEEMEEDE